MMPESGTINLDRTAAKSAQAVIQRARDNHHDPGDVDNLVTKALGVLQEFGVYACALFLLSRSQDKEKAIAAIVHEELLGLATELPFGWARPEPGAANSLAFYSGTVTQELEPLLLTKETFEQMLIYARYGAKAWSAETGD